MNKKINITFKNDKIEITSKNTTKCDLFRAITCLLEEMDKISYMAIRSIITKAEKEYKDKVEEI